MKVHTYLFDYTGCAGTHQHGTIDAVSKTNAFNAAMTDTRLKGCTIIKSSFRRLDTCKGKDRAGGLDENGKQIDRRRAFELEARKRFINLLDRAIDVMYEAGMENNGAVLSLPIKDLYKELTKP